MGLTPEQVAFFQANGYLSNNRRRGYATHYVSARCRYTGPEPRPEFPLVRGRAHSGAL